MAKKLFHSNIPPQVLASLGEMLEVDRKIRASELLASYEQRASKLDRIGEMMAIDWVINQALYFQGICAELREIIATGDLPERA